MKAKQRVLQILIRSKEKNVKYQYDRTNWITGGWVPANVICMPNVGGLSGLRRLRELKENGIEIEHKYYVKKERNGNKKTTHLTIYRLVTPSENIDFDRTTLKIDHYQPSEYPKFEAQIPFKSASLPLDNNIHIKVCKFCLKPIYEFRKNQEFCSRSCKDKYSKAIQKRRYEIMLETILYYADDNMAMNGRAKAALKEILLKEI